MAKTDKYIFVIHVTIAIVMLSGFILFGLNQVEPQRLPPQQPLVTPTVIVTCECPDYEEGWDDAQFSEGWDPRIGEISIEELRIVCDELDAYGYVPGC